MQSQQGFSLLELLIAIAIITIMLGLFGANYITSMRKAEVRTAATQVYSDIINARSKTQRESQNYLFTLVDGGKSYSVGSSTEAQTKQLPSGITVSCIAGCDTDKQLIYTSPYAVIRRQSGDNGGMILEFSSPHQNIADFHYYVKVMGVTGKASLISSLE